MWRGLRATEGGPDEACRNLAGLTAERDALLAELAEAEDNHAMVTELYNAAVSDYTGAREQLAEAVKALEPFARIGGYVTEECGWTPDDEIELMFGDRGHVLATTEARHFIRAREVHRKAKRRSPVEKQNSGDNP